jgi:nucleotide-binding universal stress UspA family protein
MNMKVLVAYDGTLHAKKALRYGISKLRDTAGELTVLQVFESTRFVDYDAGPAAEAAARREAAAQLEEAKRILIEEGAGIPIQVLTADGDPLVMLQEQAATDTPDLVVAPRRFSSLIRTVHCPVALVPGTVLVPVDSAGSTADRELIAREAKALSGSVLLVGIVPVHLFGKEEKAELAAVRKATEQSLKRMRTELEKSGLETKSILRDGYPDEVILAAAEEHAVSLILLPAGGTTPSELSKAAAILQDEGSSVPWPLLLVPEQGMA